MILVDADLAGDPIQDIDFCNDCDACAKACPLQAMTVGSDDAVAIDLDLCSRCQNGASPKPSSCDKVDRYAAACGRACMIALADKITNKSPSLSANAARASASAAKETRRRKVAFVEGVCPKR